MRVEITVMMVGALVLVGVLMRRSAAISRSITVSDASTTRSVSLRLTSRSSAHGSISAPL